MADFLFEIGLEEVPARMIASAQAELARRVVSLLERERLVDTGTEAKSFATPRRLAVLVAGVREQQADVTEELMGPSAKIAFKDSVAGPAAVAFAKKSGIDVSALKIVDTPKGEYVAATAVRPGRSASEVIASELPKEIAGIYWAKNMRWMPGKPDKFVRPVRWMLALLGSNVVPVEFAGKSASDVTFGHRVLFGDSPLKVISPDAYEQSLHKTFVIADVEVRRERIRQALDKVCRTVAGARWREDHGLVDKLTQLTEWPTVILGSFEQAYLDLPEEVLVTVMRDHQSYFAVDDASGKLAPHFLAVLNTETDAAGEAVIRHGNERVLRARFNDARFFWEFDQRVSLTERVALLEKVTFQKELGSYASKTERVQRLAAALGAVAMERGATVDLGALDEAARLAKTDLTAELVKEFTELQGVVGGLYARAQGASQLVSEAIYDQYRPAGIEGAIPRSLEGVLLGIADRADTIAGMFGLGLIPTGSKDPFALRRAANGIVKLLADSGLTLKLSEVAEIAAMGREEVATNMVSFFAERLEFYLREARGQAYDVVKAVLAAGGDDVRDAAARAEAVTAVRGGEDFAAVSAAFKRMKNILAQAAEKGILDSPVELPTSVTMNPAQTDLHNAASKIGEKFQEFRKGRDYVPALELIATMRPAVDRFFNEVMVMDDDPYVRYTRLSLLHNIVSTFSEIADFSEIVTAG